jgi:hypothetical protein
MNRECTLTKRVRTAQGWRYCRVVLAANGRVKPGLVIVNGNRKPIPKALTTSNGLKARSACAYYHIGTTESVDTWVFVNYLDSPTVRAYASASTIRPELFL